MLVDRDVKLVITVDCGITSVEPVRQAIERGIDVIITDHHLPPELLPEAAAVLNPKQPGCAYPFKELAGVGVAFKLCCELMRREREEDVDRVAAEDRGDRHGRRRRAARSARTAPSPGSAWPVSPIRAIPACGR